MKVFAVERRLVGLLIAGLWWLTLSNGFAEGGFTGVEVDVGKVVKQQLYEDSRKACGPTAMINVMRHGTPEMQRAYNSLAGVDERARLRLVIDRYFKNKHSRVFPRAKRLGHHGVLAIDLKSAFSDLLKDYQLDPVSKLELNRLAGESDRDFLERVHEKLKLSLRRGVPPIIQLRTYMVNREGEVNSRGMWKATNSHFVVVTRVPSELREQDEGFTFDAIDSNGGRLVSAYVYGEKQLSFRAEKGPSSPTRVEWLSGRPFLLVKAPGVVSLQPHNATWDSRVIVTLCEVIGRF